MSDRELLHLELNMDDTILYSFDGVVTQNSVVTVAKTVEAKLLEANEDRARVRTIFELIVEIMQNMLSYSADSTHLGDNVYESKGAIIISLDSASKQCRINSGNDVYKEKQKGLIESLEEVNSIPLDEIKDVYKARRRERRMVHSRGAGLGFLDMARKSKNRLDYAFKEVEKEDRVYFELYVKV